jgi:septal ring factor EnvC (AmiA/AmiB activator)
MAGIFANVDSDIQKLQKLKQEIENVKKSLKSINVKVDIDIAQGLEAQLKSLTTQYDALAAKVGETEARITTSANKIIDASNKIIRAQEKMSQAEKVNNVSSSSTSSFSSDNASETASIQAQAKAYEELKAEIGDVLGTRGQNIKRLIEEQNAIRLLNAEIKKITKSQGESSSLSSAQQRRLEQLNNSLLTHKTALAEVRQSLSANAKLDNAVATSMDALSQSLGRMRAAYRALTESERTSPFGKELLVSIQQADAKIKELDATIGNHQRNVGNYASGWNGLSMSIQQIGRELPSLASGWRTFFLAISNNLPILADEIKRARIQFEALRKSGQAATPVWKQVVSSIVSWQTALTVGITLLTLYGDKLVKWISGLGKAEKAIKNLYTAQRYLYNVTSTGIEQSSKEITKLNSLYKIATDVTKSTKERNNAVKELKRSFPSHLKNLSDESIKNGEVAKSIKEQTRQIIANAKATAAADQIAKNWYKSFQAGVSKNIAYITKQRLEQELVAKEATVQQLSQMRARPESYAGLAKEIEGIKDRIKETDREIAIQENLQDSYQKSSQSLEKLVTVAGLGGKYEDPDEDYNSILDQQKKIANLLDKQALERKRREEDLENQAFQARINTMEEGEAKIRAQRALDNKKEIQDLKRQKEDYIRTEIEYQKKVFDEQEELKAKKIKGYKKKTFDSTSVSVDTSVLDSINQDILKGQANDVAKYYKEVLAKYQDYTAQRIAIEKQFLNDEKKLRDGLAKAKSDSEKKQYEDALKELDKQRKKTIDSISKSEIEDSGIWKMLMGDVDALPTDTLEKLLSDAEQLVKTTNLSATDMKAMMDTINNARQNLIARNPFKTLKEEYEKYQKAIKKGDKQGAFTSWSNVEQASESIKSNISTLGASLSSLGTTFSDELGEGIQKAVDVINDGITAFEVFGKTGEKSAGDTVKGISGIIGIITTLVGTVMNAFDSTKAEQERNIEYQRRQEGYWDSINYQTERYLELLKEAAGNDYFATATQSLTTLEKAREKAYKDIIKSMPVGDVDAVTFGLAQLFKSGKFAGKMTEYAYGGPQAKEIFDFIQANGGYDLENKLISEEAIWAMKSNADIWSKLPEWMQQAIDKFVEFNDKAKELEETLNEDLFQTTSKGIEEAILEGLKGGKRGIADFGEDFEEIMRNALLQSFVIDQLRGKAQEFYKKYTLLADSDKNGKLDLTVEEISDLRKDWNDIIRSATEEAKNIDAIVGASSSSSQEASKKGFATASQDSIDELNGRFTALQIAGEEIKSQNQLQTMSILELRADMLPIIANTTGIKDIASETRDLLRLSYEAIVDIRDNTNVIVKPIQQMASDIAEVKRNTSKL